MPAVAGFGRRAARGAGLVESPVGLHVRHLHDLRHLRVLVGRLDMGLQGAEMGGEVGQLARRHRLLAEHQNLVAVEGGLDQGGLVRREGAGDVDTFDFGAADVALGDDFQSHGRFLRKGPGVGGDRGPGHFFYRSPEACHREIIFGKG